MAAKAVFTGLDENGHHHELHEGHWRLHGQQRKEYHGNSVLATDGLCLQQHAARLISDGQCRQEPEEYDP